MQANIHKAISGLACLFPLIAFATATTCFTDNCLKDVQGAEFKTTASAFCKSYTTAHNFNPSAIPKCLRGCNGSPSAVSSACSCLHATLTSTRKFTVTTSCSSTSKKSSTSIKTTPTSSPTKPPITSLCKPTTITAPGSSCKGPSTCSKVTVTITNPHSTFTITKPTTITNPHSTLTVTKPLTSCKSYPLGTTTITNPRSTLTVTKPFSSCKKFPWRTITVTNPHSTVTVTKPLSSCKSCPSLGTTTNTNPYSSCPTVAPTTCSSVSSCASTSCLASRETVTITGDNTSCLAPTSTLTTGETTSCPGATGATATITVPGGTVTLPAETETITLTLPPSNCASQSTATITLPGETTTLTQAPTTVTTCTPSPAPPCYPADGRAPTFRIKLTGTGTGNDGKYGVLAPISGGQHMVWDTSSNLFTLSPTCALIDVASQQIANGTPGAQWEALYFNTADFLTGNAEDQPVVCKVDPNGNVLTCGLDNQATWLDCGNGLEIIIPGEIPSGCSMAQLTAEAVDAPAP